MSIEVRFYQPAPSYQFCHCCKNKSPKLFIIDFCTYICDIHLCPSCLNELSRKISPLSILVTTGQDIKL